MDVAALFGWPFVVLSAMLAALGLWTRQPSAVALAVLLSLPFLSYLSATPRFALIAPFVAALYVLSAAATWRGSARLAVVFFMPFMLLVAFVAYVVWAAGSSEA
jgi:hypothetical protein